MKTVYLIGGIVVVLIVVVLGYMFFRTPTQPQISNTNSTGEITDSMPEADDAEGSGKYVNYAPSVLETNTDKRRVLFFYANWCPTCRPADADFQQNMDQLPEDVVLIRVNYNDTDTDEEEKALAERYGITYQHTFVQIDSSGNDIAKWNGGQTEQLLNRIE